MGFDKRNITIRNAYLPKEIICKWARFIIPYIPVFIIVVTYQILKENDSFGFFGLISFFFIGGKGAGSYYFPIMLQVVVLYPLVHCIIKRFRLKGLITCFVINILYEFLKTWFGMPNEVYRFLVFRYFFILSYGCFLFFIIKDDLKIRRLWFYVAGIMGIIYIFIFNYTSIEPIITTYWTTTSVFSVCFIVPIMFYLMKPNGINNRILELFGKASYNIMFAQMLYYLILARTINKYINMLILELFIGIVFSCFVGIIFYKIENPITRKIVKKIRG